MSSYAPVPSVKYDVEWRTVGTSWVGHHHTRVAIIPGYTTVEDIPKIIAVSRTGRPSDASVIEIIHVEEVGS